MLSNNTVLYVGNVYFYWQTIYSLRTKLYQVQLQDSTLQFHNMLN